MVAINLLRERRTYQRRHRQKIHSNPKGKSLEPDGDSFPPTRGGESSPITSLEHAKQPDYRVRIGHYGLSPFFWTGMPGILMPG